MADPLSQNEIDTLLAEMTGGPKPPPSAASLRAAQLGEERGTVIPGLGETTRPVDSRVHQSLNRRRIAELKGHGVPNTYEVYDFRKSDKLSKENIRSLQVIHESFARMFTSSISAYLRATVQIDLVSVEQVAYEDYIRSIMSSLITVLQVAPISGQCLLDIDTRLLFAMIDRLLGGAGEGQVKPGKDLTDVEKVLARNILRRALTDLANSWTEALSLEFSIASLESSAQFIQIVPPHDTVVLILFDIHLGEQQGVMGLALPYMMLKPIAGRLNAQHWFQSAKSSTAKFAPKMAERLRELTKIPLVARLGTAPVSVDAIAGMQVGEILPLNVAAGNEGELNGSLASVDLLIGDRHKFRGHIGLRHGNRLAVQIDESVAPPPTLEIHREVNRSED